MLFYVTMGYKLRRFARLAERVYKVIIGLWLRLKYKWLGYDVLGLYKRRKRGYTSLDSAFSRLLYGDYVIQLTPELCICPNGSRPKFGTNPEFDKLLEMFDVRVL